MIIDKDKRVGEYVTENIRTAHIFKKHGIDFCCGGGISLQEACQKNGVEYNALAQDLATVDQKPERAYDFNRWELSFLIDHIINVHHSYVTESLPILLQYAEKVAHVHGHNYPEVVKVNAIIKEVAAELQLHMKKEELILFPFVKELETAKKENREPFAPPFGTVGNPIRMMEHEHDNAGEAFRIIAQLTNNFSPPEGACNTFRALYAKLQEFEEDLHQHIHLENNILHRKAQLMEDTLLS